MSADNHQSSSRGLTSEGTPGTGLLDPAPLDPAPLDRAPLDPAPLDPAPVDPAPPGLHQVSDATDQCVPQCDTTASFGELLLMLQAKLEQLGVTLESMQHQMSTSVDQQGTKFAIDIATTSLFYCKRLHFQWLDIILAESDRPEKEFVEQNLRRERDELLSERAAFATEKLRIEQELMRAEAELDSEREAFAEKMDRVHGKHIQAHAKHLLDRVKFKNEKELFEKEQKLYALLERDIELHEKFQRRMNPDEVQIELRSSTKRTRHTNNYREDSDNDSYDDSEWSNESDVYDQGMVHINLRVELALIASRNWQNPPCSQKAENGGVRNPDHGHSRRQLRRQDL
jgi:hypothetical protein